MPLSFDFVTSTNAVRQSNQALIKDYWSQIGVEANMLNEDAGLFFDGTCASDACIWKFFTDIEMFTNGANNSYAALYFEGWRIDQIPTLATAWGGGNIPRLNSPGVRCPASGPRVDASGRSGSGCAGLGGERPDRRLGDHPADPPRQRLGVSNDRRNR